MKYYCCEMHVNHALDMYIAETKDFPILDKLSEEEKLSTKCDYCEKDAEYIVSRK
ncbi:MAG: CxxH/CxxC protein [Lysinibacillus sp.]|nr:CxxH/CxxC protein [Lysinibacillus sp.]